MSLNIVGILSLSVKQLGSGRDAELFELFGVSSEFKLFAYGTFGCLAGYGLNTILDLNVA